MGTRMRRDRWKIAAMIMMISACVCVWVHAECAAREKDEPVWADFVKKYYPFWKNHYWVDRELWGNRGYIFGGPFRKPVAQPLVIHDDILMKDKNLLEGGKDVIKPDTYTVKKGDCLWYIAGYDFIYGNPLQWPRIYKANKDKIKKSPDLIYPKQVFVIPRD